MLIVNVGGDADDAVRRHQARLFEIGPGDELQHGIRPIDMPIDRILVGEHALCESLADDNDGLFIIVVIVIKRIEIAAGNDRNAKRRKKTGRDGTRLRPGILYAGRMDVSVTGELQSAEAAIAPGNDVAERGLSSRPAGHQCDVSLPCRNRRPAEVSSRRT